MYAHTAAAIMDTSHCGSVQRAAEERDEAIAPRHEAEERKREVLAQE